MPYILPALASDAEGNAPPITHTSWCDRADHEQLLAALPGAGCSSPLHTVDLPGGGSLTAYVTVGAAGPAVILVDLDTYRLTLDAAEGLAEILQGLVDLVIGDLR